MKERFEGASAGNLITALKRQELVGGDEAIANVIAHSGTLLEVAPGTAIITEDAEDDDIS